MNLVSFRGIWMPVEYALWQWLEECYGGPVKWIPSYEVGCWKQLFLNGGMLKLDRTNSKTPVTIFGGEFQLVGEI